MNNGKCFDIYFFFFFILFFLFVIRCWRFSTHLKEFASHRARRWYYHATTFPDFEPRDHSPLLGFLQFGAETIAVFSNRSPNVSTTWPWKVVKVKRERHGRKRRNRWDFQRSLAYHEFRRATFLLSDRREFYPTHCKTAMWH